MQDSFVAINIISSDNKLYNKNSTPLLFYWNGEDNICDELKKSDKFVSMIKTLISLNKDLYTDLMLSYFYFKYVNGQEQYSEEVKNIQDILLLENFDSINIVNNFLITHFKELYTISFKEDYTVDTELSVNEIIIDIYTKLKERFKSRITDETITYWIMSVLNDNDHLNKDNINFIITYLKTILDNKDNE